MSSDSNMYNIYNVLYIIKQYWYKYWQMIPFVKEQNKLNSINKY